MELAAGWNTRVRGARVVFGAGECFLGAGLVARPEEVDTQDCAARMGRSAVVWEYGG